MLNGKGDTMAGERTSAIEGTNAALPEDVTSSQRQLRPGLLFPSDLPENAATVSVIIPTYNHARFLGDAIESAWGQTIPPTEVIVIDDGSTDHPEEVASLYPGTVCLRQENRGLSAARNTGVLHSKSGFLVFLDADDLLYPDALARNLRHFRAHPECVFISGGYDFVNEQKELLEKEDAPVPIKDHYIALLGGNYIGMHATVMYRREVFDRYLYDETLTACEDYDFYLRLARTHPVFAHPEKLAAYRKHGSNMSGDLSLMYRQVKAVLRKAGALAETGGERAACRRGRNNWKAFYAGQAFQRLTFGSAQPAGQPASRDLLLALTSTRMMRPLALRGLKKAMQLISRLCFLAWEQAKRFSRSRLRYRVPRPGHVHLGDLRRTTPFSTCFGYDRGGPVDRPYIEDFLAENAAAVYGRVLEVGDNAYTRAFGGDRVSRSDVLHIDPSHPSATFTGDLSNAGHIPSDAFDCIILTQTLHLIYDFEAALAHCHRILRPGGTLLMTVPGISQTDYGEWGDTWYWSFTPAAVRRMLEPRFGKTATVVRCHGNVLAAAAFLYGMGAGELTEREKRETDPHYPLLITAAATKSIMS